MKVKLLFLQDAAEFVGYVVAVDADMNIVEFSDPIAYGDITRTTNLADQLARRLVAQGYEVDLFFLPWWIEK